MPTLRQKLIRLAHRRSDLRPHLLPLLARTASQSRTAAWPRGLPKPTIKGRNAPVPRSQRSKFNTSVASYLRSVYDFLLKRGVDRDKAYNWLDWVEFQAGKGGKYTDSTGKEWSLAKQLDVVTYLNQGIPDEVRHLVQEFGASKRKTNLVTQAVSAAQGLDDMQAVVALKLMGAIYENKDHLVRTLQSGEGQTSAKEYRAYIKAIELAAGLSLPQNL
jgi:hypothetical protein